MLCTAPSVTCRPSRRGSPSPGKPEDALRDDVALDLGAAGVDRLGLGPHPAVLPPAVLDRPGRPRRERPGHALERDRGLLHPPVHLAPEQLRQARLRARDPTRLQTAELPELVAPEDVRLDPRLREPLADERIGAGSARACKLGQLAGNPLEPERV